MPAPQARRGPIVFMTVWLVVWAAAILIVLWMLGGAMLSGDLGAAPFLMIWLAFAGVGLWAGLRRLQRLMRLTPEPGPAPMPSGHVWRDDLPEAAKAPPAGDAPQAADKPQA